MRPNPQTNKIKQKNKAPNNLRANIKKASRNSPKPKKLLKIKTEKKIMPMVGKKKYPYTKAGKAAAKKAAKKSGKKVRKGY